MAYLGIDVGTGGTRALVIDVKGNVIASASAEHQHFASPRPGWAERGCRETGGKRAGRRCGTRCRAAECVRKISCASGSRDRCMARVMLDQSDEVVRPALIWCDQRSEPQSIELEKLFGRDTLIRLTCNPPLTNFTLTKFLWVRENEPKNWDRVEHVMLPKDYVRYRLTGERAIDMADASGTLLLDVANRKWSAKCSRSRDQ